jgi:hypothetical protein
MILRWLLGKLLMPCFQSIDSCDRQLSQNRPKVTLGVEGQDAVS